MTVDISAELDKRDVEQALDRLLAAGENLRPVFERAKKRFRDDQREHAERQEGPQGSWQRWSPRTVLAMQARPGRRKFGRHKIGPVRVRGRILGRLPRSFKITTGRTWIKATSRVPWSGAHQQGAVVGRGSVLPRREFLWVSQRLLRVVCDIAEQRFGAVWRKIGT